MSYCRFSSDNWTSDVYVYEAKEGVCIDVANSRHVGVPVIPPYNNSEAWWLAYKKQMEVVSKAELVKIGGPLDGKDFYGLTYQEAFDKLVEIKNAGYNVPSYVFDELKKDAESEVQ